ncbi:MAG: PAS domain S-box protein, partial [Variovorax sp.]
MSTRPADTDPASFLVRIKLALLAGLILVGAAGVASYVTIGRLIESSQARVETEDTLVMLERVASGVKTAESSLRQYILSGNPADLQSFEQARLVLRGAISRVRDTAVLPEQPALDALIARRTELAEQALAARKGAEGLETAAAVLGSDLSRQLRRQTDGLLEVARDRETLAWQKSQAAARHTAAGAQELIAASALLFLGALGWVFFVVNHYEATRRRSEALLRDSEAMSRSITESMVEGVITTGAGDMVLEANAAALELFGYDKGELLGRDVTVLLPERLRAQYKAFTAELRARPDSFKIAGREARAMRRDGSEFPISVSFGDVQVGGQRLFTALIRDTTESQRITEALRASESQLRQITDTVPALIAYLDTDQRFRFHNKAYQEEFGLSFEQINGQTLAEVLGEAPYARVRDKVEEVLGGYAVRYERIHTTPGGVLKNYAMQYFPCYGEGRDEGKVVGFFSLGTDITELRRIDRMKTEFVSTVSHELRTPLTSIRGSLGLISGGVVGALPEAAKNLVAIAQTNCERLIRLINDILDSEKIESGKMRLDLKVMDISELAAQALAANEGFAAQHGIKIALHVPPEPLQVRIDGDRIMQVLTNLLSNAMKFSPPQATVDVTLLRVPAGVRVEVTDHGPGIPEEFRERIFQKFSQADSSDTRQKGGTGLGLNISRALVEKMDGHIGFDSQAGQGTTFYFELPEWKDPVPLLQPFRNKAVATARPRILICEGDRDVARLISMMLGKAGFDSDMAHDVEQAQALLAAKSYAAITVDPKLPSRDGVAFIGVLRQEEKARDLPVVVISAMAEQGELQ